MVIIDLANAEEAVADWARMPATAAPGASGFANTRRQPVGDAQLRVVEYVPGYLVDHWCSKGHILYVVSGELVIEHEDGGPAHPLTAGMGWHVADNQVPAHRVRSEYGATVFIVDRA